MLLSEMLIVAVITIVMLSILILFWVSLIHKDYHIAFGSLVGILLFIAFVLDLLGL